MGSGVTEFWHPKIAIDLLRRPYNSVRTTVRHCDAEFSRYQTPQRDYF